MTPAPVPRPWTGRRVAVTGGTGFVGHHLAALLRGDGAIVTALVRTTSDTKRLHSLGCETVVAPLEEPAALARALHGVEVVFHAAGAVDFGGDLERIRAVNVGGTANVLAAARAAGVRRVVHTSSIVAVACSDQPEPLDERSRWNLGPLGVPYIATKREAEEAALAATGVEVVVANPGCVVGPDDFSHSEFGTFCRRFWRGRMPLYFGGGSNFVDVRDVAEGLARLADDGRPGERYLLTGENQTYGGFLTALATAAGRRYFRLGLPAWTGRMIAGVINLVPPRRGARPILSRESSRLLGRYFYFDAAKARAAIGWRPRPLAETLRDAHAFWMPARAA